MRGRWTVEAADDLERMCDSVANANPDAARRAAKRLSTAWPRCGVCPTVAALDAFQEHASWCSRRCLSSLCIKSMRTFRCCGFCTARSSGLRSDRSSACPEKNTLAASKMVSSIVRRTSVAHVWDMLCNGELPTLRRRPDLTPSSRPIATCRTSRTSARAGWRSWRC